MSPADAIALYHAEKAKRVGRVSAQLAEVRAIVARIEAQDEQHRNGGKTRKARVPRKDPHRFRCGHARVPANTYFHKSRWFARTGRLSEECKACSKARATRHQRKVA